MAKYKDKWKTTFPTSIGNQTRPEDGVDNTQEYNTDGLPQYMANDPVRYDLQNAVNSQLVSNDERLNEKIERTSDDLAAHNKDPKAHVTGIAGNAATASKLLTPRTISLTGKAAGSTSFDGSSNASINVTSVNADTANKLSTARKINITGNATGAANFDGTGDANISVTVNESKHAATATTVNATAPNGGAADLAFGTMAVNDYARIRVYGKDDNGALEIATADAGTEPIYARQYAGYYDWPNGRPGTVVNEAAILDGNGNTKFPKNVTAASFTGPLNGNAASATTAGNVSGKIYYSSDSPSVATDKLFVVKQARGGDDNVPNNGIVIQSGPIGANYNGKLYITDNGGDGVWVGGVAAGKEVGWKRLVENWGSWNINAATATKLQTPCTISLTGNASGSASFDGSGNISINTTVNNAAHAEKAKVLDGFYGLDNGNWGLNLGKVISGFQEAGGGSIQWRANDGRIYQKVDGTYWQREGSYEVIDTSTVNNYAPTKTGSGASGTWGINISGNAASATNADKVDGYHASDLLSKMQGVLPKTAAEVGQFRELVVNDSHQIKLPDGGTWAYFVYTYNSWSGDDSNGEHRTRTGAGIAAGGTVLHTDGSITSNTINAFKLSGTTGAGGADGNNIIVSGFCWRIA